jgi:hypothetical protein
VLAAGLLLHRELAEEAELATLRTIGTGIALAGMLIQAVALILAWPRPLALVLVGGIDFITLTWVAFRFGFPIAHALALPC